MSYRFMRIMVFFDLPNESLEEKRAYRKFRRTLIKNGFFMLQESVYCRMVLNATAAETVLRILKKERPDNGLVQILSITEKQFSNMICLTGEFHTDVISSDERLVIL